MPRPPSPSPVRGFRGRPTVQLPAEGRRGPVPRWPLAVAASPVELEAWAELWSTPQAVVWERIGWTRTVARYCRLLVVAEQRKASAAIHAQATVLEDRLGLTPKAMRLLLWEVVADEVAVRRRPQPVNSVRRRIKAVDQ